MSKKKLPSPQIPDGTYFSMVLLERDKKPKPSAERIVQVVVKDGVASTYITANAYQRSECLDWFKACITDSFSSTIIKRGLPYMGPTKLRIHWHQFTPEFVEGTDIGPRMDPRTGETE